MFFPGTEWTRKTPESMGVSTGAIIKTLEAIEKSGKDIHSMLIIRDGALLFEHYFAPYRADMNHSMFSCSKTFTAMLIGIAQGRGLLSIDDKVLKYFPDVEIEKPNDNLQAMTLRDLLIMGSGHGEDTFGNMLHAEDGDFPRVFLNQVVDHVPGTHFVYNTGATYMLSNILTRVTGKSALELAEEWMFETLGIKGAAWDADPKGISMGGIGLHIKPLDMARFGWMILNEGRWGDVQVVPAEYIREAREKHIDNSDPNDPNQNPNWAAGYGYQMWRCAFKAFRADGMGGQYIVMLPERGLLFVFTSGLGGDIGYPLDLIRDILLPGVSDSALPEDEKAQAELQALALRLHAPKAVERPKEADALPFGKTIAFPQGNILLLEESVRLAISGLELELKYAWDAPAVTHVRLGIINKLMRILPYDDFDIAIRARWDDGLYILVQFIGEPLSVHIRCRVDGKDVFVTGHTTLTGPFELNGKIDE